MIKLNEVELKGEDCMKITVNQLLKEREEMCKEIDNLRGDLKLIKSEVAKESIKELINVSLEKIGEFDNKIIVLGDFSSHNSTNEKHDIRSGINDVKSFRIDTGIYKAIKETSAKSNINIAEIINKSLEFYLANTKINP